MIYRLFVVLCSMCLVTYCDMTVLRVAVVGLKGGSDQSTHAHIGFQLQPFPTLYVALENVRQLLPPSHSPPSHFSFLFSRLVGSTML